MQDVNRAGLSVLEMPTASARGSLPPASTGICDFDLITYARKHRYRLRNLRDGGPVPPARRKTKPTKMGYVGAEDRADAIVGHRGYLTVEDGGLGICLFFKSGRGVASAKSLSH